MFQKYYFGQHSFVLFRIGKCTILYFTIYGDMDRWAFLHTITRSNFRGRKSLWDNVRQGIRNRIFYYCIMVGCRRAMNRQIGKVFLQCLMIRPFRRVEYDFAYILIRWGQTTYSAKGHAWFSCFFWKVGKTSLPDDEMVASLEISINFLVSCIHFTDSAMLNVPIWLHFAIRNCYFWLIHKITYLQRNDN